MKSKRSDKNHIIDFLFPVGLLLVFAICAITVLMLATRIYEITTEQSTMNYTAQTSLAYVTEKLHAHDEAGAISIGTLDGEPAVIIAESYDGRDYVTYIYSHDGFLCEMFARADVELSPESGQKLLEISDFGISVSGSVIEFTCEDAAGHTASTSVALRSGIS